MTRSAVLDSVRMANLWHLHVQMVQSASGISMVRFCIVGGLTAGPSCRFLSLQTEVLWQVRPKMAQCVSGTVAVVTSYKRCNVLHRLCSSFILIPVEDHGCSRPPKMG